MVIGIAFGLLMALSRLNITSGESHTYTKEMVAWSDIGKAAALHLTLELCGSFYCAAQSRKAALASCQCLRTTICRTRV